VLNGVNFNITKLFNKKTPLTRKEGNPKYISRFWRRNSKRFGQTFNRSFLHVGG